MQVSVTAHVSRCGAGRQAVQASDGRVVCEICAGVRPHCAHVYWVMLKTSRPALASDADILDPVWL